MAFELTARNLTKNLEDPNISGLRPESTQILQMHEDCLVELQGAGPQPSRPHPRDFLMSYLNRLGLSADPGFLFNFSQDDEFEIWSLENRFIGCSGAFLRKSSYSIPELLETDWNELFERPQQSVTAVFSTVGRLMNGERTVMDVADWHTVRERRALQVSVDVQIRAMSLAQVAGTNKPGAFLALLRFRDRIPWKFGSA